MSELQQSRRGFLKLLGLSSGGLLVTAPLTACASAAFQPAGDSGVQANPFIFIGTDNQVTLYLPQTEMGQGVMHGLSTLVAEELNLAPQRIHSIHAPPHDSFANPLFGMQLTGGSTSIAGHYEPLRHAAAQARELLLSAAAQKLSAPKDQLVMQDGEVIWQGQGYPVGDFAEVATTLPAPDVVTTKQPQDFRFIGKDSQRVDGLAKVTGQAEFGMDVDFPGLYRAVVKRCPVIGGKVKRFDASQAQAMAGVKTVVEIFNGVAVVADNYWQAKQAANVIEVEWDKPNLASYSSANLLAEMQGALEQKGDKGVDEGNAKKALKQAAQVVTADYSAPFLAHATMETMNCTVKLDGNRAEVWVPSQGAGLSQEIAHEYSGIDRDNIVVHTTMLGGGFGRRANQDYVAEAVSIAKAAGVPVQLVWSREDDMQNDFYRPAAIARMRAGVDSNGTISAWTAKRAGPNIMPYTVDEAAGLLLPEFMPQGFVEWISKRGYGIFDGWQVDHSSIEGLYEGYDVENKEVRHVTVDPGLRVGFWRSVGHSFSGFFAESFMDEVAHATGQDPVAIRLAHTHHQARKRKVIEVAAEKAGWGQAKAGISQGVAAVTSFSSHVAQVVDVSVENNQIKVHRVVCVVDCGRAVNPDMIKSQMESGIIFGMTAALHGDITLDKGSVVQSNFHDYPLLRMQETPEIDVHIIDGDEAPTGVGEPGLPPIAAAIGNAVFAATGQRLRQLPLRLT
ncbi:xanthine dehydrogenase family protein molybdopterin-binding subunit [Maricurvus nonylphenolicus]|uniref:xanthine dehydrogenase family protein molybdopterin-binding subunit n=1 Tax=Maricurvus nonylphenolicus TaxID=1008307 RepID=UPI0036F39FF2